MRRSGEICGAYGGRVLHEINEYEIEYSDDGNSCTYHRVTHVSTELIENVKSSETSWIAVCGKDHMCLVTLDVDWEMPDLFGNFSHLPVPEAIVSVIPDTDETQARGDAVAISEYNEMLAINFLRKILRKCWNFYYGDTVLIAIIAFRRLLSRIITPNELKIFVAGKDNRTTISLPIDKIKTFLDVSHGVTASESIDIRSALSSAVSLLQDKGMGSLETSDTYVNTHYGTVNESGYHRRTHISDDSPSAQIVKSSGTSWIAVQGQEALCFVTCGTTLEKPEKPDLIKFFDDVDTKAIVSVALRSNDVQGGSGIGVPIADDNEKSAVNFLKKNISKRSTFTFKETLQTAFIAHHHLCPEILKDHLIEIYVLRKADQNVRVFSVRDIDALDDFISEKTFESRNLGSSQGPDVSNQETGIKSTDALEDFIFEVIFESGNLWSSRGLDVSNQETGIEKTSHMERRTSYNRETQIWCGGWDSKLLCSFGFSWIAVQGKDSVCVVTQDEVVGDKMFWENVIYHMIGNELFGADYSVDRSSKKSSLARPFAAVSVVVDFGKVNKEISPAASRGEIKAVEFLAKKLKEISDFTYETTVQTAISACLCLVEDFQAKEIKAFVFRRGELPTTYIIKELPDNEIKEHLRKPPKHLLLPEEDSASSSKRTRL